MSSWRDQILKEFTPKVARLTLVADPDGLLLEEGILEGVRERGFELIPFEDHIAFRYAYESKFRFRWDRGEHTDLVVVLRSQASDLGGLPFDLLQAGRRLSFNLGDIFPNLSYPVVTALDRGDLDALFEPQRRHAPGQLGDNATKEFVLRHVFEIAPELIKQPSDLLRVLLRRHFRGQRIPPLLDERFIQLLRQSAHFDDWSLETLVTDGEAFFAFLQERWPIFLDREAAKGASGVREDEKLHGLAIEGPVDLPFDHHDIRVYIDNLFVEGVLHSVPHDHADALSKTWVGIGLRTAPIEDRSRRLGKLIDSLQASIPADDAKHTEWFHFARGWAELVLLMHERPETIDGEMKEHAKSLQSQLDAAFTAWLFKRYAGLVNLPPVPPVMLHHLPRFLARQVSDDRHAKIALLVVDGLAMDQWLVIRTALASRQPGFRVREEAVFAWVPSLTPVSRQAAFAGRAPIFFPNSIETTEKEPALWSQFWVVQGFTPNEVVYIKGLGDGSLENVSEALAHPKARIAGLVVDKVDKIMHGMEMGTAGMHNQVRQWAEQPYLRTLLELLLERGFHVYLTSDHGNIEARGCGRPNEGAVADLRGERVRIYADPILRHKVRESFPSAVEWPPLGIPDDYLPLLAPPRQAFVSEHQRLVSHGGISVEELIVPLVQMNQIGFSQRVRLEWLEQTANLVLAGNDKTAVNDALQEVLRDKVSVEGQAERGNREKIISILLKVWLTVPTELESLRTDGVELLKQMPRGDHLALHWGMVMAVYPFWASVATQVGRLLRLQRSAAAAHIQRRVREQYGERETVSRAARRVLRSYVDWGVLQETGEKGVYRAAPSLAVDDTRLMAWLVEAFLHSRVNRSVPLKDLCDSPSLFPFDLKPMHAESLVASSSRLDILRHGLDDDLVMLKQRPAKGGTE